jgi:hypothetical protein
MARTHLAIAAAALTGLYSSSSSAARADTCPGPTCFVFSPGIKIGYTFGHGVHGFTLGVEASALYWNAASVGGVLGIDFILGRRFRVRISLQAEGSYTFAGVAAGMSAMSGDGRWLFGPEVSAFLGAGFSTDDSGNWPQAPLILFIPYYRYAYFPGAPLADRNVHDLGLFVKASICSEQLRLHLMD